MQGPYLRKYGVQTTINFVLYEVDGVDFRVDAVDGGSDCSIMKDEGAEATCTNDFTDEGTGYSLVLTATEMQAARIVVYVIDTATKVWLDESIVIETYGNASAMHAIDLDDAVRAGLTALPNAAADAAGGLPISDAGELDIDTLLGRITGNVALASGVDLTSIHGSALTETVGGYLAAAFVKLFDVATPLLVASDVMRGTDGANTTVPDAAGTAAALHATTDGKVDGVQADLDNATDGLGALKALIDAVQADLDNGTDGLGALKALIDGLNNITSADVRTAMEASGSDLHYLMIALVNKAIIREATGGDPPYAGDTEQFNDSDVSIGTITQGFTSDGFHTTRKRMVQ